MIVIANKLKSGPGSLTVPRPGIAAAAYRALVKGVTIRVIRPATRLPGPRRPRCNRGEALSQALAEVSSVRREGRISRLLRPSSAD